MRQRQQQAAATGSKVWEASLRKLQTEETVQVLQPKHTHTHICASENGPLAFLCKLAALQSSADLQKISYTVQLYKKRRVLTLNTCFCCHAASGYNFLSSPRNLTRYLVLLRLSNDWCKHLEMGAQLSPVKKKTTFVGEGSVPW